MRSRSNNALGNKPSGYGNQSSNSIKHSKASNLSRHDSEEHILEPIKPYGEWKRLDSSEQRQITKTTRFEVQTEPTSWISEDGSKAL